MRADLLQVSGHSTEWLHLRIQSIPSSFWKGVLASLNLFHLDCSLSLALMHLCVSMQMDLSSAGSFASTSKVSRKIKSNSAAWKDCSTTFQSNFSAAPCWCLMFPLFEYQLKSGSNFFLSWLCVVFTLMCSQTQVVKEKTRHSPCCLCPNFLFPFSLALSVSTGWCSLKVGLFQSLV